jgi:site-specific DNA recombinase
VSRQRCALYARFSSDRQRPTSIADQVRRCRDYAASVGWEIVDGHIYSDEAISGTSTERAGLQQLLAAATSPSRPFDCILIDDTSRLTRKLADALNLYERLKFAGIRIVAISQGVDSQSEQAELLIGVHGLIDAVYWRELAQKTHRGMQGRALQGYATGGRCFGYQTIKGEDGSARLEVNSEEAQIVRRIFEMYGRGFSYRRIAHRLNAEGVPSPQPQRGRHSRSWCTSSVRKILTNERYLGKLTWNTTRKLRVPGSNRRIYRPRPRSEWVTVNAPHLRIVPDELWDSVKRRFAVVRKLWSRRDGRVGGQQRAPYLFSGLLRCGECGGSVTIVAGRWKGGSQKYGCSVHSQRGDAVCTNSLLIHRDELEARLLQRLQEAVLREEVINYTVARLGEELERRHANLDNEVARLRERSRQLDAEIARLVEAIAQGQGPASLTVAIAEREKELRAITNRMLEPGPGTLQAKLDELRDFALSRLSNLRALLSKPENVYQARALLAEQVGKITLAPENGTYVAKGSVDFFGDSTLRVECAGGRNRTAYAGLFRAALYR